MGGLCRRGGRTERFSSAVMEEEKGLSQFQSLNHLASPSVLFSCSGGSCTAWRNGLWMFGRAGMVGRDIDGCGICFAAFFVAVDTCDTEDVEKKMVKKMNAPTPKTIKGRLRRGVDWGYASDRLG